MSDRMGTGPAMPMWLADVSASWIFLTRIPLPAGLRHHRQLTEAMWAFPVVGAIIGGLTGVVLATLAVEFPAIAAATLAIGAALLMTGALHEDGLADVADGFGGGATREGKLEIMRDSRIGAYGVLALGIVLLLKASALAAIAMLPWYETVILLAATGSLSRAAMVWLLQSTPPARMDGLARMAGRPSGSTVVVAAAIAAGLGLVAVLFEEELLLGVPIAAFCAWGLRRLALRQVGGVTGDVCGTVQVVTETAMLLLVSASIH